MMMRRNFFLLMKRNLVGVSVDEATRGGYANCVLGPSSGCGLMGRCLIFRVWCRQRIRFGGDGRGVVVTKLPSRHQYGGGCKNTAVV